MNVIIGLPSPTSALTINNQTIQGSGQVGANTLQLTNQSGGVIQATTGLMTVDPNANGMVNQGTL